MFDEYNSMAASINSKRKSITNVFETNEAIQIRKIIDKYCGIFKFSSNVKLYCNFCRLELSNHGDEFVQKHLNSADHSNNFSRKLLSSESSKVIELKSKLNTVNSNRCITITTNELVMVSDDEDENGDPEVNKIDILIDAYQSGVLVNRKFDKIYCTQCNVELRDSLLLVKKHLLNDGTHLKNMENASNEQSMSEDISISTESPTTIEQFESETSQSLKISNKIHEFIRRNSDHLEWNNQSMIHCKLCNKIIQAKYFNLVRHCHRQSHVSRLTLRNLDSIENNNPGDNENKSSEIEKVKMKNLIEMNANHLLIHSQEIYCRLCDKLLGKNYNRIRNHLNHSMHLKQLENVERISKNPGKEEIKNDSNLQKIIKNLLDKDHNRLKRLLEKYSNHLSFYNQCKNVICKPCNRIMLAKYVNVHNHLRRQSHSNKKIVYEQQERQQIQNDNDNKRSSTMEDDNGKEILLLEQIPFDDDHIVIQ